MTISNSAFIMKSSYEISNRPFFFGSSSNKMNLILKETFFFFEKRQTGKKVEADVADFWDWPKRWKDGGAKFWSKNKRLFEILNNSFSSLVQLELFTVKQSKNLVNERQCAAIELAILCISWITFFANLRDLNYCFIKVLPKSGLQNIYSV